jgi:hypothetical protein
MHISVSAASLLLLALSACAIMFMLWQARHSMAAAFVPLASDSLSELRPTATPVRPVRRRGPRWPVILAMPIAGTRLRAA